MLHLKPIGISARFKCDPAHFEEIYQTLQNIGHVVVEDIFHPESLNKLKVHVQNLFSKHEKKFLSKKMNAAELYQYYGSTYKLENTGRFRVLRYFINMIECSKSIDLYRYLLKGDFASLHFQTRKVKPMIFRSVGLHFDGQVSEYAKQGYNSQDEYTMWTPLSEIDALTPGILLLRRGLNFHNCGIDLTPLQLKATYLEYETSEMKNLTHHVLKKLIEILGDCIYAPHLSLGSAVIFKKDVLHGSFAHDRMKNTRHSIDARFIADFNKEKIFHLKEPAYIFHSNHINYYSPFEGAWVECKKIVKKILYGV